MRTAYYATDLGAAGDGVADDTAALQAAIDMTSPRSGGRVVLPPGEYRVTAPLRVHNSKALLRRQVTIEGESNWFLGTDINSGPSIVWDGNDTDAAIELFSRDCVLRGLQIRAASGKKLRAGVWMKPPDDPDQIVTTNLFDRLFVNGQQGEVEFGVLAGDGGAAGNNEHHKFVDCQFLQCSGAGVHVDDTGGQAKFWMFHGCHFRHGRLDLVTDPATGLAYPDMAVGVWFRSGSFQMRGRCNLAQCGVGVRVDDKCYEPVVLEVDSEGCPQLAVARCDFFKLVDSRVALDKVPPDGVWIDGGRHITIDNCVLQQNWNGPFVVNLYDGGHARLAQACFGHRDFLPQGSNGNVPHWSASFDGVRHTGPDAEGWYDNGLRKRGYDRDKIQARFDNGIVEGVDSERL